MWRGGCRSNISVAASFVWRCLTGSAMAPFPHPAHRTGQADFPHPALGQDFTLSRATPSAASEHLLELIGCPISKSLTTCCVCLELRSLPSTGVTRLPRYYEPLRHPRAPSLSLTGFRLVIADHALGLPVLRTLSLCTCRRQYPGVAAGRGLCPCGILAALLAKLSGDTSRTRRMTAQKTVLHSNDAGVLDVA